ncbi:MAG: hypothetical protein GX591_01930 [Planctomycetes bacterium]|nr:hypothetical protein [Planctomycetota bacterium]
MNRDAFTNRADLSAYLDGQLTPEQAARVERALQTDPQLRAELKALDATRRLLGDLPRQKAPEGLLEAVMERAERERLLHAPEPTARSHPLRWVRPVAAAAIIVLTVGLGLHLHHVLSKEDWVSQQHPKVAHGPADYAVDLARDIPEPEAPSPRSLPPAPERPAPAVAAGPQPEPPTAAVPQASTEDTLPVARGKADTAAGAAPAPTEEAGRAPLPTLTEPSDGKVDRDEHQPWAAPLQRRTPAAMAMPSVPPAPSAERVRREAVADEVLVGQAAVAAQVVTLTAADVEETAALVKQWLQRRGIRPMAAEPEQAGGDDGLMARCNTFFEYQVTVDSGAVELVFHVPAGEAPAVIEGLRGAAAMAGRAPARDDDADGDALTVMSDRAGRRGQTPPPAPSAGLRIVDRDRSRYAIVGSDSPVIGGPAGGAGGMDGPGPRGADLYGAGFRGAGMYGPGGQAANKPAMQGQDTLTCADAGHQPVLFDAAYLEEAPHTWLRQLLASGPAATQPAATQPETAASQAASLMGRLTRVVVIIAPAEVPPSPAEPASRPAAP